MHPQLARYKGDTQNLRLILGIGRSGTTWLSTVLSKTRTPIRCFIEGLYSVDPKLRFSAQQGDHTAIEYYPTLSERHPLLCVYRSLTVPHYDWAALGLGRHLLRDDPSWQFCLVKEVHSLLASEALLKFLVCPTVLVVRDPVYVVDSLFARDGLGGPYLLSESKAVGKPAFLERFAQDQAQSISKALHRAASISAVRQRVILEKVLTVAIIRLMLRVLASEYECAYLVEYEALCRFPQSLFQSAAAFLTLDWGNRVEKFHVSTMHADSEDGDIYPVFRETSKQLDRAFKFLSQGEVSLCRQLLRDSGLNSV